MMEMAQVTPEVADADSNPGSSCPRFLLLASHREKAISNSVFLPQKHLRE